MERPSEGGLRYQFMPLLRRALLLTVAVLFVLSPIQAQLKETRRVVVLNEQSIAAPAINSVDRDLYAGLQDESHYRVEFYIESLDTALFPDETSQRETREAFIRKYQLRKPDVIVAVGPTPINFMIEDHERFFPRIPVVFCCSTEQQVDDPRFKRDFTGVWFDFDVRKTLSAALRLLPDTKLVTVVDGVTTFDKHLEDSVRDVQRDYEAVDFKYLGGLDVNTILNQVKTLPHHSIILFTSMLEDGSNKHFSAVPDLVGTLADAADVPLFTLSDTLIGQGAVGGSMMRYTRQGRAVAGLVLKILDGAKPQDIPVTVASGEYMFDWRALRRWGIKEASLPPGSIVLNRQPTFWELYWRYVITGVFLLSVQTLVILALLRQRAQRKEAQTELLLSHGQLREREERFRLAVQVGRMYTFDWDVATDVICRSEESTNIFGLTGEPGTLTKRELLDRVHPEDRAKFMNSLTACAPERPNTQISYRFLRPDGSVLWLERSGHAFFDEEGKMVRMIGMVADITERKRAEEALSTVSQKLIEAHEEERTRIARELHDDINQQLALLAVNLESLKQGIPDSAVGLAQRIGKTSEQIADIAKDIQALSHRLHSSKLEYLGLTAAAKSFCREFSDQQKVEISFQSENIPKELPQEVSVCLFRVLQEALQNATKYSGSQQFQVLLRDGTNQIELTVRDSGIGFDPEEAIKGRGLGLTSMRERLKLVNGELSIDSRPQRGTTVRARVPINTKTKSAGAVAK